MNVARFPVRVSFEFRSIAESSTVSSVRELFVSTHNFSVLHTKKILSSSVGWQSVNEQKNSLLKVVRGLIEDYLLMSMDSVEWFVSWWYRGRGICAVKKSESSYSKDPLEYNTVRILKRITKMSKRLDVSGNSVKINICFSWWKFWEICDIYKDFLINQHLLTGPWVWTWLVLTQFLREHSTQLHELLKFLCR